MNTMTLAEAYDWNLTSESGDGFCIDLYEFAEDAQIEIPFLTTNTEATQLDFYYYLSWSGDKIISPALEKIMAQYDDWTDPEMREVIVSTFWKIYGEQLLRQWENFTREYDPIDDYDITEETDYSHSGRGNITDSGSDTRKKLGKVSTTDSAWTYDSNIEKNTDKSTTTYGENTTPMTDETEYGKRRATAESAEDDLTIHKYGNLGINPISDFLKKDIDLWKWNFYKKIFFPALDSFLTIPIY